MHQVIGCMSGTSLDGLDLALCLFEETASGWKSTVKKASTFVYDDFWKNKLSNAHNLSAFDFSLLNIEFGRLIAEKILDFACVEEFDLVASHGHTVFHTPQEHGLSVQIGDGSEISAILGKPIVYNFRQMDVSLGGNGAPLVPVGEKFLYPDFECFLNLGGIANISFHQKERTLGFDVVPCNMVLNHFAQQLGFSYDKDGINARNGKFSQTLFDELNQLDFYALPFPKSLGREWVENVFELIELKGAFLSVEDKMNTMCHHIAYQISNVLKNEKVKVMVTGGGAFNQFLFELISTYSSENEYIKPEKLEIEFKEAKIFAFLGLLRVMNQENVSKSITGAVKDSVSGVLVG
ncbi:MAG: anhydro-N-acetylmuramic acid kinase [Cytophagales bacterium]